MNRKKVIKNSFYSFTAGLINRIGTLIFTIILARLLMPENYGVYSLVFSIAMVFYTFSDLGINQTLTKYLSYALAKEKSKVATYYQYLIKLKLILVLIASLLLLVLAYPISFYIYKNPAMFAPLLLAVAYIFISSFDGFYTQLFYSIERVDFANVKEIISQVTRIFLVLLVFFFIASNYQIIGVFASLTITSLVLVIISWIYIKKIIPEIYNTGKSINQPEVRKFTNLMTIISISGMLFSYIDALILGYFVSPEFVGYYRAAFTLVLGIIGLAYFPSLAFLSSFSKTNKQNQEKLFNYSFKYLTILSIPFTFALIFLGNFFIRLFYGYSYLPAALPLGFLAVLIFPASGIYIFSSLFSAKNKPGLFAKLIILTSIIDVVLNFVIIYLLLKISPIWAASGAAIATLISWAFYFVASNYYAKKHFSLSFNYNLIIKPVIASIIMSIFILVYIHFIGDMNLVLGIILIIASAIIYFASLFLIKGIKKQDIILLFGKNEKNI